MCDKTMENYKPNMFQLQCLKALEIQIEEGKGYNSLRSDKCPQLSNAFSCRLRGSQLPGSGGPDPEPRRRWELAEGTPALRWR